LTDFFQSPSDKLRLEMMLKSLSAGDLNLAILGEDEVALAHYARKIYEHLKTDPNAQVDLCLSADAEKLVQRFNQILSELTLDEALDKSAKAPQKRFLIFPDTQFIQDFELQLLARLINGLPASNLFVVLIFNKREPYEKKLQSFGKNLVQWVLESEHPSLASNFSHAQAWNKAPEDEVMSAKDFKARQKSLLGAQEADDFLNQSPLGAQSTGYSMASSPKDLGKSDPVLSEEELMAAVRSVQEQLDKEEAQSQEASAPEAVSPSARGSRLGWGLLFGLLVSMGVLGAVYKERIVQEVENMKEYLEGPKWEKKPVEKSVDKSVDMTATDASTPENKDSAAPDKAMEDPAQKAGAPGPTSKDLDVKGDGVSGEKQPTVGMSSTTKTPIKLGESLIPDREAVLTAKELKDKSKTDSKDPSTVQAPRSEPQLAQNNVPNASTKSPPSSSKENGTPASEKSDLRAVPLPLEKNTVKDEPLKIPILKDPLPSESNKAPTKVPVKALANETPKAKEKESSSSNAPAVNAAGGVPQADLNWVNALPENSWVLQLVAMPKKAEILAKKASQPAFEGSQVLFTKNPSSGKSYYILIKGPLSSKEEAQALINSNAALSGAWLRSSKSLKAQFKGN